MTTTNNAIEYIDSEKARSAWMRGVKAYAREMAESIGESVDDWDAITLDELQAIALNGARDWSEASWGGCALIYNGDIASRLCTHSELKRTDYGRLSPNSSEDWLDVQARALAQAFTLVKKVLKYR